MKMERFVPAERLRECVHCGLCLPACPTYSLLGLEADSPRGRIHLMRAVEEGEIALSAPVVEHFDRCLGCLACESACPSGVRYRELIEAARASIERAYARPFRARLLRALVLRLFPYRRRLSAALVPIRLLAAAGLWPRLRSWLPGTTLLPDRWRSTPPATSFPARGTEKGRVALLTGCVAHVLFGDTHAAICRLLSQCGYRVEVPANQTCCGALALHLGAEPLALALARQNLHAFAGNDGPVLVAAAGCGAVLKDYARLFAASPEQEQARAFAQRVRDATEFFASLALPPAQAPPGLRVAYVDACHLAHGQGVRSAPRALLRAIGGLELVELPDEFCCGSAGSYSLFEPRIASALGARKAAAILDRRVQLVAVANPGCALQLGAALRRAGAALPVLHPVEIYTRALDGSLSSL